MQWTTDGTDNSTFTIESAPFTVYRFAGMTGEAESIQRNVKNSDNVPASWFKPDTIVRVQYGYRSNSLWRALVTFRSPDSDSYDVMYCLAR